ncbi:g-D-glutamyl-meso-diaminopimelate peptidase [Bacillus sp. SORGH_AS 510]|uniref:M14 family zinc carboxypeptidase n=1 Tax=Bacillus sp. SORGH_AS_0510 TaxID=3041771 RepID=UPI002780E962|nr:M14 family zinc carboxypeptidase [Bacillus sp. SORGH_AS_0510]MDQ1147260.1 g-D-glutamyl-meso-diaminopimelate peptidase [Bacillus sp. SORGH_AS_0510]
MNKFFCAFIIILFYSITPTAAKVVHTNKAYSYEQLENDITQLKKQHNGQLEVKSIGTTHFGREIWAIKVGKGKRNIVLIGAHHGREWLTSMLLMKMLETYAATYEKTGRFPLTSTSILNEVSIWFVPMLNPDGVTIQQNHFEGIPAKQFNRLQIMNNNSSNFSRWKANGTGIDLNRQYPAGWTELPMQPTSPHYQFYKGKRPLEAKEVIALTNFIKEVNPSLAVAYHSAGREIFWNYKNGKHLKRDRKLAKKIAKITGYKLAKPPKKATGGGFTDWFITTYHRPAMTIEISYLVGETNPPLSVFKTEWKRNRLVGLKLAKEAEKIPN